MLNVGSIVTGDIRGSGDSVQVTVRLVDGATSAQLSSVMVSGSWRDVLTVRSSIIDSVASFLRNRIGVEINAVAERSATSAEAWKLIAGVKDMGDGELQRTGTLPRRHERAAKFAAVDSLIARAIDLDPRWHAPLVQRAALLMSLANIEEVVLPRNPSTNTSTPALPVCAGYPAAGGSTGGRMTCCRAPPTRLCIRHARPRAIGTVAHVADTVGLTARDRRGGLARRPCRDDATWLNHGTT